MKSVTIQKYQLTQNRNLQENKIAQPLNEIADLVAKEKGFKCGPNFNHVNFDVAKQFCVEHF